MSQHHTTEQRTGPRYVISLPVRAEWDDGASGEHVVVEGQTKNVGPMGALVHLETLPDVGSRVQIAVMREGAPKVSAVAEVLRIERNPAQPLAALQLMNASDEWRGLVWEPSAPHLQHYEYDIEDD
ncbi:MAG TPA: PilZ domain-containing protein [Pyrinomonadaceae bacterium]|nr:PilZ domain-containing protein [Pyrinomonadaceae bacterium]